MGPCQIGDNAVIAAGVVIVPGTIVPANTVFAGVPAKYVKTIEFDKNEIENEPVYSALLRENGIVFIDGTTDKRVVNIGDNSYEGHLIVKKSAFVYAKNKAYIFAINCSGSKVKIRCGKQSYDVERERRSIVLESGLNIIETDDLASEVYLIKQQTE